MQLFKEKVDDDQKKTPTNQNTENHNMHTRRQNFSLKLCINEKDKSLNHLYAFTVQSHHLKIEYSILSQLLIKMKAKTDEMGILY